MSDIGEITPLLGFILSDARQLAGDHEAIEPAQLLAAMIRCSTDRQPTRLPDSDVAMQLLWDVGLRWNDRLRLRLGIMSPEERAEAAERAELARLKAKYEGGVA
jgi:hypothetical protein